MHVNTRGSLADDFAVPNIRGTRGGPFPASNQMRVDGLDNDVLDFGRGNAGDRSDRRGLGLTMEVRQRDVVAIADAGLGGVGRHHAMTGIVEQQSRQQVLARVPDRNSVGPLIGKLLLNGIKQGAVQDRRLLAGQNLILVCDLTDVEAITQQIKQRTTAEGNAAPDYAGCERSLLRPKVPLAEVSYQRIDAAEFQVTTEDQPGPLGLGLDDGDLAVFHLVAEGQG